MYGRMRAMWPMSEMMDWPSEGLPWPTEVLNEDFRQTEPVARRTRSPRMMDPSYALEGAVTAPPGLSAGRACDTLTRSRDEER
jgi:hypothetical protein